MTASQMRIAETIDAFYGDAGANDGVSRSYKQAVEDLDAETIKALDGPFRYTLSKCQCGGEERRIDTLPSLPRQTVLEPISRFCAYFPDINECRSPPIQTKPHQFSSISSPPPPPSSLTHPPRHKKTQPQTPRLRRHPCQSKKTRRKTRQRPHQTPPRRTRFRPRQNRLRSPQRPTLLRITPTNRFTRALSRSEL